MKTSWGIWISISGDVAGDAATSAIEQACRAGDITLRFTKNAAQLSEEYRLEIARGITIIADQVADRINPSTDCLVIDDVQTVETDFQLEGLKAAAIRWAEDLLDLPARPIETSFDSSANRYVITIAQNA